MILFASKKDQSQQEIVLLFCPFVVKEKNNKNYMSKIIDRAACFDTQRDLVRYKF